jgi:DNA-binding XRE family transcriptional regulator
LDNQQFIEIRYRLGITQKELANQLLISRKAVQSYEQGWRRIPKNVERHMLLLLFWEASWDKTFKPCWEIRNCPTEWREICNAYKYKEGDLCWFVNGTFCQGKYQKNWAKKIKMCKECEVFKEMIPITTPTIEPEFKVPV